MDNLYTIDAKLKTILNEIEENGGEITEEQLKELELTQDNLKEKLNSYKHTYLSILNDIEFANKEKKRIDNYKKVKENSAERIKTCMLDAVVAYGDIGKTGNRTINIEGGKLFTRKTRSIDINGARATRFKELVFDRLRELYNNDMFINNSGIGLQDIEPYSFIDSINANYKAEYPQEAENMELQYNHLFTVDDLYVYGLNINFNINLSDLIKKGNYNIINAIFDNEDNVKVEDDFSKTDIKNYIDTMGNNISVASDGYKDSLTIK